MNTYIKRKNIIWQKIVIGLVGLIFCIAVLNIFLSPIKNTFYNITSPFQKMLWNAGNNSYSFFGSFFNAKGLAQENNNLKQENQQLLSQVSMLQETVKQNQAIQSVVQNTQGNNFAMTLAEPLGVDAAGDTMLLDKGSANGISENMPVISSTKVLYGKIVKVYKNYSQMQLISSATSVVDVKIQQTDTTLPPIYGAVKGSGNLALYLDLVVSTAKVNPGDVLVTSGLEGVFPKDLLIGKITSVNKNDLKPFQTAQIQSFFDVKSIDNLFIITNYKK